MDQLKALLWKDIAMITPFRNQYYILQFQSEQKLCELINAE